MSTNFFSTPGRTEISGYHTDHQRGCVWATAVNPETVAEVIVLDDPTIIIRSEGYVPVEIIPNDLSVHEDEKKYYQGTGSWRCCCICTAGRRTERFPGKSKIYGSSR